eukprot:CAMPEP_0194141082 /NCGR_PEP_ID=MMETSP0152-20130528/10561_1 /TAXON_ID=1049557 /ORGANISM="Thalassiothrix antarctica, Strain L6-D1" /LENGTH=440 /DNA_ID=CAMNT_0038839599 /DNA_START=21 /DNA_END=1343 /DNA_ORIENTATION=+
MQNINYRNGNDDDVNNTNNNRTGVGCELVGPDACGNDMREEKLLEAQKRDDEGRNFVTRFIQREKFLLIASVVFIILLNLETGRFVLYPFELFTTWVHEMSHGTAAMLMGGKIADLVVNKNGSGYCSYSISGGKDWQFAFVASAGYTGAAFWGCILLLFRRTTLGPTIGTIGAGAAMILSVILYIRDEFGVIVLVSEGLVLMLCGWCLPAMLLDWLYSFLGIVCTNNAIEDIRNLYGHDEGTDAHAVANLWGQDANYWATIWLFFGLIMFLVGIIYARDAKKFNTNKEDDGLINDDNNTNNNNNYQLQDDTPTTNNNNNNAAIPATAVLPTTRVGGTVVGEPHVDQQTSAAAVTTSTKKKRFNLFGNKKNKSDTLLPTTRVGADDTTQQSTSKTNFFKKSFGSKKSSTQANETDIVHTNVTATPIAATAPQEGLAMWNPQ